MLTLHDIGLTVQAARKAKGLTQQELAALSGLGRSTLAALETGKISELGIAKIVNLLAILDLELRIGEINRGRPTLEDLRS